MSEIEDQLGAILGNPKMMADIMALVARLARTEPWGATSAQWD